MRCSDCAMSSGMTVSRRRPGTYLFATDMSAGRTVSHSAVYGVKLIASGLRRLWKMRKARTGTSLLLRDAKWARAEQGPRCWLLQMTWPQPRTGLRSQYGLDWVFVESHKACWRSNTFATGEEEEKRDLWTRDSLWWAISCRSGLAGRGVYLQAIEACLLGDGSEGVCASDHAGHQICYVVSAVSRPDLPPVARPAVKGQTLPASNTANDITALGVLSPTA